MVTETATYTLNDTFKMQNFSSPEKHNTNSTPYENRLSKRKFLSCWPSLWNQVTQSLTSNTKKAFYDI